MEVFFHDQLHLWVCKYKESITPGVGVVVDEVVDETEQNGQNQNAPPSSANTSSSANNGTVNNSHKDGPDGDGDVLMLDTTTNGLALKSEASSRPPSVMDMDEKKKNSLPPPAQSVASYASSSGASNSSMRRNRLPPPPPSVDWATGSRSTSFIFFFAHRKHSKNIFYINNFSGILGKRQGSQVGADGKRMDVDDVMSISSVDESVPTQELAKLDQDRRNVKYIPFDRDLEFFTYDGLVLGRKIGVQEPATYVDTTFCARNVLEHLMEVKVSIEDVFIT